MLAFFLLRFGETFFLACYYYFSLVCFVDKIEIERKGESESQFRRSFVFWLFLSCFDSLAVFIVCIINIYFGFFPDQIIRNMWEVFSSSRQCAPLRICSFADLTNRCETVRRLFVWCCCCSETRESRSNKIYEIFDTRAKKNSFCSVFS